MAAETVKSLAEACVTVYGKVQDALNQIADDDVVITSWVEARAFHVLTFKLGVLDHTSKVVSNVGKMYQRFSPSYAVPMCCS
jgi:hypothetical protein